MRTESTFEADHCSTSQTLVIFIQSPIQTPSGLSSTKANS